MFQILALLLCVSAFCFPITAFAVENTVTPTIRAWISGDTLRIETSDAGNGIEAVYINDSRVNYLVDDALDVALKDYAGTGEYITVYAVDFSGNKSNIVQINNPYFTAQVSTAPVSTPTASDTPASTQPVVSGSTDVSTSTAVTIASATTAASQSTTPTTTTPSVTTAPSTTEAPASDETPEPDDLSESTDEMESGETEPPEEESIDDSADSEENPFTLDGTGTVLDSATESDGKEFFTIITADENEFYLIIDRERSSDNVYLLNPVTEDDLLSLAKKSDSTGESAIPMTEPQTVEPSPEPSPEPETEPESSGNGTGTIIFIIIAVLAVGGVGYYIKILKPKRDAEMGNDDDNDDEDYYNDGYDMDEVDEDDESDQELLDEAEYSDESNYDDGV